MRFIDQIYSTALRVQTYIGVSLFLGAIYGLGVVFLVAGPRAALFLGAVLAGFLALPWLVRLWTTVREKTAGASADFDRLREDAAQNRARARASTARARTESAPRPLTQFRTQTRGPRYVATGSAPETAGLTRGSFLTRAILGRGWRDPDRMARGFGLAALLGAAIYLFGLWGNDYFLIRPLASTLEMIGTALFLIGVSVVYAHLQSRLERFFIRRRAARNATPAREETGGDQSPPQAHK
ncbi:hypothetical protein C8N32_11172 [Rhodovulum imhoffii]|uniref:Uncharacterized protein n=1 Tax=Rhodovulum imhoffii TaxID=365340 RepID=A0A2T5BR12_9RHOB|nr:hypothetical protein [Rhodovulum imhoffii]MBK5934976.1 hypothetical protein [Rhodovulum imhoffii]PTN01673.1 hypothetical protein C8N32_11172 [Rhodovulum imhoffii]